MAYELNLTAAQYEAVYEINLDYLMSLNGHGDVFGIWWDRRNADLRFVLNSWQYDKYVALIHFYRPVAWKAGGWTFAVYSHYGRDRFYNAHPTVFVTQIPNGFAKIGFHQRPDFILSAPNRIEVCHTLLIGNHFIEMLLAPGNKGHDGWHEQLADVGQ